MKQSILVFIVALLLIPKLNFSQISPSVKERVQKFYDLIKNEKIQFTFNHNKHHKASVDCCHFEVNEFRDDPSSRHFDHKSSSCGVVSDVDSNFFRISCDLTLVVLTF